MTVKTWWNETVTIDYYEKREREMDDTRAMKTPERENAFSYLNSLRVNVNELGGKLNNLEERLQLVSAPVPTEGDSEKKDYANTGASPLTNEIESIIQTVHELNVQVYRVLENLDLP